MKKVYTCDVIDESKNLIGSRIISVWFFVSAFEE